MPSKTPLSLLDKLRTGLAALGRSADRTVRRIRGATPPVPAEPEAPRPKPIRVVDREPAAPPPVPPAAEVASPPARPLLDPLGDTISALRAFRHAFGGIEAWSLPIRPWSNEAEAPPIPDGARFDRHVFTCAAGTRDYRLYEPASLGSRPNGLVVMLHGCRQTPEDFALGTRMNQAAETRGLVVAYPHQPTSANPNGCWNWYRLSDQMRHGGEPAILAGIVHELMERWGLEREQVFVAGLSAGGAMTAILTHTHPELFAAACIHSGVAAGLADDLRSGLAAMRGRFADAADGERLAPADVVPTIVFQGDADQTVHPSNADRIFAAIDPGAGSRVRIETRVRDGSVSTVTTRTDAKGSVGGELWHVAEGGHAWFGGDPAGSYAVATGPDSTAEMLRFFAIHGFRARRPSKGPLTKRLDPSASVALWHP